jgi:hypothetical protein
VHRCITIFSFAIHESIHAPHNDSDPIPFFYLRRTKKQALHKWGSKTVLNKHGVKIKCFISMGSHSSPVWKFFGFIINETQSDWDRLINKGMADCLICDAKMKYYSKAYCKTSHGYQYRENTDCFQSKLILGRRNEEVTIGKNWHLLN